MEDGNSNISGEFLMQNNLFAKLLDKTDRETMLKKYKNQAKLFKYGFFTSAFIAVLGFSIIHTGLGVACAGLFGIVFFSENGYVAQSMYNVLKNPPMLEAGEVKKKDDSGQYL